MTVLNNLELNSIILIQILMLIIPVIFGMNMMMIFIISYKIGCEDQSKPVAIELRAYIDNWGETYMRKTDQGSRTQFFKKMVVCLFMILI